MKLLLKLAAVLLLGLVLLVVAFGLGLDHLVAEAIRRGATYATGVETTLGSADISLRGGSLELSELRIANPEGFTDDLFLGLGRARLALETGSLFDETIEVAELSLAGIEANLERKEGRTNYDVILDHLAQLGGPAEPAAQPPPAEAEGPRRTLHVELIRLSDLRARVRTHLAGLPQSMSVTISEVTIEDFRSDGTTTEIVAQLTRAVIQAVLGAVVEFGRDLPADFLQGLGGSLDDLTGSVQREVEEAVEGARKQLEGLLGGKKE
jgi:hypothetical protein